MLKITFSISSFVSYLSPRKHQKEFVAYDNFISIGLNEWFDSAQVIYILEKDLLLSTTTTTTTATATIPQYYTLSGKLQKGDSNRENHLAVPEVLCQYIILQKNRFEVPCCQRSSNSILLDWTFIKNPGKLPKVIPLVKMMNKLKEVVCQFQVTVHKIEIDPLIFNIIPNNSSSSSSSSGSGSSTSRDVGKILTKLHQSQAGAACATFRKLFKCCHPGTSDIYVFQDINFWKARPLFCYLDTKVQPSNEAHWVHIFQIVMRLYVFDNQLEKIPSDEKTLWMQMSVSEQMSILVDMCIIGANNSSYITDFVESPPKGNLVTPEITSLDDFSSLRYNAGDCEDCSNWIHYCFRTFRRSGPYKHYALNKLHKLSHRYECVLNLAGVNKPSMSMTEDGFATIGEECDSYMAHMTTFFIHKDFLLQNMLRGLKSLANMKLGAGNATAIDKTVLSALEELIEQESKCGYLDRDTSSEFVVVVGDTSNNSSNPAHLPMVLVGEGTGFLNSNGVSRVKFPKLTDGGKVRLYQGRSDNNTFMRLHFIGITNYFLQNNVNIPTFAMTYDPLTWKDESSLENGYVYGVRYSDLMTATPNVIFVPLTGFPVSTATEGSTTTKAAKDALKKIINLGKIDARSKHPYPALWRNEKGPPSSFVNESKVKKENGNSNSSSSSSSSSSSCCRWLTSPKGITIPSCITQKHLDELFSSRMKLSPPMTGKGIGYNMISPWIFYKTRYMYIEDVLWWEYEQLHEDLSIFIVYFPIIEGENDK